MNERYLNVGNMLMQKNVDLLKLIITKILIPQKDSDGVVLRYHSSIFDSAVLLSLLYLTIRIYS